MTPLFFWMASGSLALLNERIRMVNNTITMLENKTDTCMNRLNNTLDKESMEECMVLSRPGETLDTSRPS